MSENKEYYCGPYYAPKWLKKFLSHIFNMPCKLHDQEYEKKNKARLLIDFIFLLDMMVVLLCMFRSLVENSLKFLLGCIVCPLMFLLVVLFGWISYRKVVSGKFD
jgi:hypothetical protein